MKYRCKVTSPWGMKGAILTEDDEDGGLWSFGNKIEPEKYSDLFEPIEEEKPKRWALAAYFDEEKDWVISDFFYHSKSQAAEALDLPEKDIIFPARFDADGFLIVPEGDK